VHDGGGAAEADAWEGRLRLVARDEVLVAVAVCGDSLRESYEVQGRIVRGDKARVLTGRDEIVLEIPASGRVRLRRSDMEDLYREAEAMMDGRRPPELHGRLGDLPPNLPLGDSPERTP
jgi:hypothetical protein